MSRFHYQPQDINDEFSEKVFNHYLESLDPSKRFLTASDVEQLKQYQYKIDDELESETFQLFDLSVALFEKRREETKAYYKEILEEPFDFNIEESLEGDPDKMNILELYRIRGYPTTYLIDRDGIIVEREFKLRGSDLEKTLAKYIAVID